MQSYIVTLSICCLLAFLPVNKAAESCVPSTGACTPGSVAAPCCLPSVCKAPETGNGPVACQGDGVACTPTGNSCTPGQYPYCCPQQTCQGGICKL